MCASTGNPPFPFTRRVHGRINWRGHSAWHWLLDSTGVSDFEVLLASGSVVKTGRHRTVHLIETAAGQFFVKQYRARWWERFLPAPICRHKPRLEQQTATRLHELDVPTAEVAAVGRVARGGSRGDTLLVTRAIRESTPLDEFLSEHLAEQTPRVRPQTIHQVARSLGTLVARLHAGGVLHGDLHAGNFVIRVDPRGGFNLSLIDLHPVRHRRSVSLAEAANNFTLLSPFFELLATRSDKQRMFRAYWAELERLAAAGRCACEWVTYDDPAHVARHVARYCERAIHSAWRRADAKWARGNRRVRIVRRPGGECRALAQWNVIDASDALEDPLFEKAGGLTERTTTLADVRTRRTLRAADVWEPRHLEVVSLETAGLRERSTGTERYSRIRRRWEFAHALLRRGIKTARPVLFVEVVEDETTKSSIVLEPLLGETPLGEWLIDMSRGGQSELRRRELKQVAQRLARCLRVMHENGIDCGDLSFASFGVDAQVRVTVSDDQLETCERWRRMPQHRIVRQLTQLESKVARLAPVPLTLRLHFLKHYLGERWRRDAARLWNSVRNALPSTRIAGAESTDSRCDARDGAPTIASVPSRKAA